MAESTSEKVSVDQLQLSILLSDETKATSIYPTKPLPSNSLEAPTLPPIANQIAQAPLPPNPIPQPPLPSAPLPPLPPPDELLPTPVPPATPSETPAEIPQTLFVQRFAVVGSRVFTPEEFAAVTAPFTGREISFAELLQARSAVTQLYVSRGYVTSGAFIPPQTLKGGVVKIQVIEGSLEDINITGTRRLQSSYVRSRIRLAASTPLNVPRLLEGLQLLQLDPLIESISADLQAGTRPGISLLQVQVAEADTFSVTPSIDNGRSPSVGSFRRQLEVRQANLIGFGDDLQVSYNNTDGSNGIDTSYTLPLNPRNGTLRFSYGITSSSIIDPDFEVLNIDSNSRYYEISYRQPLFESPSEEFTLGITASRQESQAEFLEENLPFPSLGADENGRTKISALRFFQEWTQRSNNQVLAARSQVSLGLNLLDSTINERTPDSRFLSWRGQGQWVRLLAPDTLLLVRGDVQLADGSLLPSEQFGLGGQETVRGYRQDALLTDNGALLSTEIRIPILRVPSIKGLLQVTPFVDLGTTWNSSGEDPNPNSLIGAGVGLLWGIGDTFSARLDWGIPLIRVESSDRTWQENGVYFSVRYTPF
ncbi:MAG: ShlB/FhaC/HecB family hemolysin secretion/activation protein [Timaviella obliquedivisa GSE-PSE-MK23-08B]|nr:ShlB/FhaC/HecB family hemolysin secretion/activation protein [Timaviella obliquedivisa GSE-PSE-MK23-08B]